MRESVVYFAGDEEILSLDDSLLNFGVETLADFMLICIAVSAVKVAITDVNRVLHSLGHDAGRRLTVDKHT